MVVHLAAAVVATAGNDSVEGRVMSPATWLLPTDRGRRRGHPYAVSRARADGLRAALCSAAM